MTITIFDPNIPEAASQLKSEPLRKNLNALNDRTNQLSPTPTTISQATQLPSIIGVSIGQADKIYFDDNKYTPFAGGILNLASSTSGVSKFSTLSSFKEIIVFYKRESGGDGTLGFIESIEKLVRDHSVDTAATLINDITLQRVPDGSGNSVSVPNLVSNISPLDDTIIICSVLVTNSGVVGVQGAINPLFEVDIIDLRPFLEKTPSTKALYNHINASSLAAAHPAATIPNELLKTSSSLTTATVTNSYTLPVGNGTLFNPTSLGYQPFIRISPNVPVNQGSVLTTARVLSVSSNTLTLDHQVSAASGSLVIIGDATLDKMAFDLVDQLSDVLEYTATGEVQLKATATVTLNGDVTGTANANTIALVGGKTATQVATSVNDTTAATNANTASTIVKRDGSGNFTAGTVTASLTGNASTATKWLTTRTISLTGDVTGSASIDGSSNISIATTVQSDSIVLGADTTGNYIATIAGTANQVLVSGSGNETAAVTLSLPQSINTTANVTFNQVTASLVGNSSTATILQTARNINGVSFNGSADITVTAAAVTLTGNTLASGVTASSLTSVGTLTSLTVTNPISGSVTGSAGNAPAGTLTGTTLASGVTASSLTSVGALANLTVTNPISGSVTGSAGNAPAGTLTGATLASGVTASSLTSVGSLASLTVGGAVRIKRITTSSPYAITSTDYFINITGGLAGDDITFPVGADGRYLIVRNDTGNSLDLIPSGGDLIEISTIATGISYHFIYDSSLTTWLKVN